MKGSIKPRTNYLIIFLIFSCIKLCISSDINKFNISEITKNYNSIKEERFYFISRNDTNLSRYLKIELECHQQKHEGYDNQIYNDYIISYYKDSSFKERKQLSQSNITKAVMWLNKAQIKGGFYLSVECFLYPCNYTIKTNFKDNVEIDFDRAYTYYVTEDNKEMEFNIKGNPGMIFYDDEETSKINCKISI